jgi:hypothetical protein
MCNYLRFPAVTAVNPDGPEATNNEQPRALLHAMTEDQADAFRINSFVRLEENGLEGLDDGQNSVDDVCRRCRERCRHRRRSGSRTIGTKVARSDEPDTCA